jgi:hypothetical protein
MSQIKRHECTESCLHVGQKEISSNPGRSGSATMLARVQQLAGVAITCDDFVETGIFSAMGFSEYRGNSPCGTT